MSVESRTGIARWTAAIAIALLLAALWFTISHTSQGAIEVSGEARRESSASTTAATELPVSSALVPAAVTEAAAVPASESPTPTADSSAAAVPEGVVLYGLLLPAAEGPRLAQPAGVAITDHVGKRRSCEVGPRGEYSFSSLAAGRYWILAQSNAGGEARKVVDIDAGDRRLDLQLEPRHEVSVEVVDHGGNPIRLWKLIAVATIESPGDWFDEISGSPNNMFGVGVWTANGQTGASYPAAVLGCVRLSVPPPVFVSLVHNQRVVASQRVEAGQSSVRFELDAASPLLQKGSLRLRLVDAQTRDPLAGVSLQLFSGGMQFGSSALDGTYRATTWPGWLGLRVLGGKYENPELRMRVEPGVEVDLGDIALGSAVFAAGRVVDDQGHGVAGTVVYELFDSSGLVPGRLATFMTPSSADGSFRIDGLSRSRYRLRFMQDDSEYGRQALEIDTRTGSIEGLRMEVARGMPLLVSGSDERWPLVRFEVFDDQGVLLLSSRLDGPEPQRILLAPGRHEIEVTLGGVVESPRRKVTIASDPVELSLP